MAKEIFSDNTYSLAKALHHINLSKQYFEDVRYGTKGEVKAIFNQYIQKCDWTISDVKSRLSNENRELLAKELEDSLSLDAIMDKLIHLDVKQKEFIEDLITSMINGEEVIIVDDKNK